MIKKIKSDPNKPLILITNDDSIYSKGIRSLIDAVKDLGQVVVVAPSLPQSGMGHAVTLKEPIRLTPIHRFEGVLASYACSGTPVDSVKIARDIILDRKPDICLSGINHGSNSSINSLLNVNIPNVKPENLKGYRICRQAVAKWEEEFEERTDPRGGHYYWLTGKFVNYDDGHDTDEWALANNFVSVVPIQFDLTNYHNINYINNDWELND